MRFGIAASAIVLVNLLLGGCKAAEKPTHYRDRPELTPLMNAAAHNDLIRAQALISRGANVSERTKNGETALYEAIERTSDKPGYVPTYDNVPMVELLLKNGANPNEVDFFNNPALSVSLTRDYGNPAVTLLLLRAGAPVPTTCPDGDSMLSLATQDSDLAVMQALIDRKVALNCVYGETALHWAAMNGQADRVALLLKAGADPKVKDTRGHTPLEVATTTNPEARVQADFAKTRALLGG